MKITPFMIAIVGAAVVFYLWKSRQGTPTAPRQLSPSSVPPEWIAMTPAGAEVPGTTNRLYDILT
jgi:hypothetical protein